MEATTFQKLVKLANDSRDTQQMSLIISQRFNANDMRIFNRWLDLALQCRNAKINNAEKKGYG